MVDFYDERTNVIEHPKDVLWELTEDGDVRVTKRKGDGTILWTQVYTTSELSGIIGKLKSLLWIAPKPEPMPAPEPTPDPAPRATGGTPDTGPVKPDASRARPNARRTIPG